MSQNQDLRLPMGMCLTFLKILLVLVLGHAGFLSVSHSSYQTLSQIHKQPPITLLRIILVLPRPPLLRSLVTQPEPKSASQPFKNNCLFHSIPHPSLSANHSTYLASLSLSLSLPTSLSLYLSQPRNCERGTNAMIYGSLPQPHLGP